MPSAPSTKQKGGGEAPPPYADVATWMACQEVNGVDCSSGDANAIARKVAQTQEGGNSTPQTSAPKACCGLCDGAAWTTAFAADGIVGDDLTCCRKGCNCFQTFLIYPPLPCNPVFCFFPLGIVTGCMIARGHSKSHKEMDALLRAGTKIRGGVDAPDQMGQGEAEAHHARYTLLVFVVVCSLLLVRWCWRCCCVWRLLLFVVCCCCHCLLFTILQDEDDTFGNHFMLTFFPLAVLVIMMRCTKRLVGQAPHFTWSLHCYHYVTETFQRLVYDTIESTDEEGETTTSEVARWEEYEEDVVVTTHEATKYVPIAGWMDTSAEQTLAKRPNMVTEVSYKTFFKWRSEEERLIHNAQYLTWVRENTPAESDDFQDDGETFELPGFKSDFSEMKEVDGETLSLPWWVAGTFPCRRFDCFGVLGCGYCYRVRLLQLDLSSGNRESSITKMIWLENYLNGRAESTGVIYQQPASCGFDTSTGQPLSAPQ